MPDRTEHVRHYINYLIPREVVMPVLVVFSIEHVIEGIFSLYVPPHTSFWGWVAIAVISIGLTVYWGETDEDKDEFEDELEEYDMRDL